MVTPFIELIPSLNQSHFLPCTTYDMSVHSSLLVKKYLKVVLIFFS